MNSQQIEELYYELLDSAADPIPHDGYTDDEMTALHDWLKNAIKQCKTTTVGLTSHHIEVEAERARAASAKAEPPAEPA